VKDSGANIITIAAFISFRPSVDLLKTMALSVTPRNEKFSHEGPRSDWVHKKSIAAKQKKRRSRNEWFTRQPNGGREPHL
jgi:hypothetical protein